MKNHRLRDAVALHVYALYAVWYYRTSQFLISSNITHLVQDIFAQDGFKWDV